MSLRTLLLWLCLLFCGCLQAAVDTFILVPDQNGHTGSIVITSSQGSKTIKKTYSMVKVDEQGNFTVIKSNLLCIDKEFDDLLAALPKPKTFLIRFIPNTNTLDDASKLILQDIIEQIKNTQFPFIVLHGDAILMASVRDMLQQHPAGNMIFLLDTLIDLAKLTQVNVVEVTVQ